VVELVVPVCSVSVESVERLSELLLRLYWVRQVCALIIAQCQSDLLFSVGSA
jgi:hypothetical protein